MHTNELTKFASSPNKIQWISGDHCFDCTNSHLKVSEWVLWQVCNSTWCLENIWPTTDRSMRQQFQDTWGQAGFWQAGYRVSSHWENAAQFARTQHSDAGHCLQVPLEFGFPLEWVLPPVETPMELHGQTAHRDKILLASGRVVCCPCHNVWQYVSTQLMRLYYWFHSSKTHELFNSGWRLGPCVARTWLPYTTFSCGLRCRHRMVSDHHHHPLSQNIPMASAPEWRVVNPHWSRAWQSGDKPLCRHKA